MSPMKMFYVGSVLFVFNLRLHIIPGVIGIIILINWVFESLKKSYTYWSASAVVETEADQGTGTTLFKLGNALQLFMK